MYNIYRESSMKESNDYFQKVFLEIYKCIPFSGKKSHFIKELIHYFRIAVN